VIKFEYNGKVYAPSDVEKKLKKLGITINDVKILNDDSGQINLQKKSLSLFEAIMNTDSIPYHIFRDEKTKGWLYKPVTESTESTDVYKYVGTTNPPEITSDDIVKAAWRKIIKAE